MATRLIGTTYKVDASHTVDDPAMGDDSSASPFILGTGYIGGADVFQATANISAGYAAVGEGVVMEGTGLGGNDRFVGAINAGTASESIADVVLDLYEDKVVFVGDSIMMFDDAKGGLDVVIGGNNTGNLFIGDAVSGYDDMVGGNDNIRGGNAVATVSVDGAASNLVLGDAFALYDEAMGGNDSLAGGGATVAVADGESFSYNAMAGDAAWMSGGAGGGADTVTGGTASVTAADGYSYATNLLMGDGYAMQGSGGNDSLRGGNASVSRVDGEAYADNMIAGDGYAAITGEAFIEAPLLSGFEGGNDRLFGGSSTSVAGSEDSEVWNLMAGDVWLISGAGEMGNDSITGGNATGPESYTQNVMYGDVGPLYDAAEFLDFFLVDSVGTEQALDEVTFGNDTIVGGNAVTGGEVDNWIVGDAEYLFDGIGGNDSLRGGGTGSWNNIIGDADEIMGADGGRDTIVGGGTNSSNELIGDAYWAMDGGGGNDVITAAGANSENTVYGDAVSAGPEGEVTIVVEDSFEGGNDTISAAGARSENELYGDWGYARMSQGGNDTIRATGVGTAIDPTVNELFGEGDMSGGAGGNDTLLVAGAYSDNQLYGEGEYVSAADCGDDVLTGATGALVENELYGDAFWLSDLAGGGNDRLTGGGLGSTNELYGDAYDSEGAIGGDDTIIGGAGNDDMWGDWAEGTGTGGEDTFVFKFGNGTDVIWDFDPAADTIDLTAMRTRFASLEIMETQGRIVEIEGDDGGIMLRLDATNPASSLNTLTIVGVTLAELEDAVMFTVPAP